MAGEYGLAWNQNAALISRMPPGPERDRALANLQVAGRTFDDNDRSREYARTRPKTPEELEAEKLEAEEAEGKARQLKISQMLQSFYQEMNAPLDYNDPYVKSITNGAYGQANRDVSNRGLGGDWAQRTAMEASANAGTAIQQQRRQLGLQALGMTSNHEMGLAGLRQNQFNQNYQAAMGRYQEGLGNAQAVGAIGGGIIGAIPGIVTLNPALAAAGAGTGSQLGGGLGGLSYSQPMPTYRGSRRGLGGNY